LSLHGQSIITIQKSPALQNYTTSSTHSINIFATCIQINITLQQEFTLTNIHAVAKELWQQAQQYKVWSFTAAMGSGKTTFIHALCDVLGVTDAVGSPTFSIINQYKTNGGQMIYHLDLYRIKDEEEALQAGVEDVLYSGELCLVEWPEKIPELLPQDALRITIETINSETRRITVHFPN
jgi:tRNA threonylcarbamoyladenosine biosynthesis protein TsaE